MSVIIAMRATASSIALIDLFPFFKVMAVCGGIYSKSRLSKKIKKILKQIQFASLLW
jgi:hypothetical protein